MIEPNPELNEKTNFLVTYKHGGNETRAAEDIEKLKKGDRFEYVLGWTYFCGQKIDLSLRPFIPRKGTEQWVTQAIEEIKARKHTSPIRCLDPFSGCGCVGITILLEIPEATVDFFDIDKNTIKQTRINLDLQNIPASRYSINRADSLNKDNLKKNAYHYILANPPYVPYPWREKVKAYLHQEPRVSVFGGDDGLYFIKKFLAAAHHALVPGGKIWIEHGNLHEKDLLKKVATREGYINISLKDDSPCMGAEKNIPRNTYPVDSTHLQKHKFPQ